MAQHVITTLGGAALLLLSVYGCAGNGDPRAGARVADADVTAALQRWERCVQRVSSDDQATAATLVGAVRERRQVRRTVSERCEGYRRDVAAALPQHLEDRVHARLLARERERVVALRGVPSDVEALARTLDELSEQRALR